jgi:hypothetical protein
MEQQHLETILVEHNVIGFSALTEVAAITVENF